jgi:hypothetical protein
MKTCRECGEPVRWVVDASTGLSIALDTAPCADGTLYLERRPSGRLIARQVADQGAGFDGQRYRVHRRACTQWGA